METMQFMRDDLGLSFTDADLESYPYVLPEDVPELVAYAKERRAALDGFMPTRTVPDETITLPGEQAYADFDEGTKGTSQVSTTMAFVRVLRSLMKDKEFGQRVVPIIPDEARTFGMEGMNGPPLEGIDGVFDKAGFIERIGVDHHLNIMFVGD